jgi:hypothetical protein
MDNVAEELLTRLHALRDMARDSECSDELYIGLIEACALCEGVVNPPAMVDVEAVAAGLRRKRISLVPRRPDRVVP